MGVQLGPQERMLSCRIELLLQLVILSQVCQPQMIFVVSSYCSEQGRRACRGGFDNISVLRFASTQICWVFKAQSDRTASALSFLIPRAECPNFGVWHLTPLPPSLRETVGGSIG